MNIVEVDGLVKQFGMLTAVDEISFDIKKGEIFGFLGPNGAGKSTTVNMLTCQLRKSSGNARVCGIDIKNAKEIREKIGVVPQELSLNDLLTASQNLYLYGSLYNVPRNVIKEKSDELLDAMGLLKRKDDLVKNYSGGMKQRLNVILALLHKPDVLFMDEPTTGMDPQARRMIWDFIKRINAEGMTIFLTTHYMEEADYLCNRIAIIDEGKIQAIDTPRNLKRKLKGQDILEIQIEFDERLIEDVESVDGVTKALYDKGMLKLYIDDRDKLLLDIATKLSNRPIKSISSVEPTLEDVFISITGKRLRD
ncbi:MAG: ATP-binding cassette domain-containing protein [Candidatus Methanofastidiosa archaeon]|nr:ATP-binding cassette domain-containing protein [Candidatus Methanofastidiosa archaeon]